MKYQIGDLLRCPLSTGDAICMITTKAENHNIGNLYEVYWIIEKEYVKNTPAYQTWAEIALDRDFVRLS